MTPQVAEAVKTARALKEKAREHKRSVAFHRREGKRCMRALAELREKCAAFGIKLVIEGEDPQEGSWPSKKAS